MIGGLPVLSAIFGSAPRSSSSASAGSLSR
jgi:hypothetical protein